MLGAWLILKLILFPANILVVGAFGHLGNSGLCYSRALTCLTEARVGCIFEFADLLCTKQESIGIPWTRKQEAFTAGISLAAWIDLRHKKSEISTEGIQEYIFAPDGCFS